VASRAANGRVVAVRTGIGKAVGADGAEAVIDAGKIGSPYDP
jgi:hypothetical protein